MELVLGSLEFASIGGTQTYLLTVAEQLQLLGHEVTVYAERLGEMAALAERRSIRVVGSLDDLPAQCDAMLARDGATAAAMSGRYPSTPLLFVAASETFDFQQPPQLLGAVSAVVALDDRVADRMRALALESEVIRLRQPVDTERFRPRGPVRSKPCRVLLLGNYLQGDRHALLAGACEDLGLELNRVGAHGEAMLDPSSAINDADVVVAKGRAVVEAMACGRAAYVYDFLGCDGWVTPERYPLLEADGFAGRAEATASGFDRLRDDLAAYHSEMGQANRDLIVANHLATRHAQELVRILRRQGPREAVRRDPLREVARLIRAQAQAESRTWALSLELEMARRRIVTAEAEAEAARAKAGELQQTRRYRFGAALARPVEKLRELRGRAQSYSSAREH